MARKNIFNNLMHAEPDEPVQDAGQESAVRKFGAAKSISSSIDELARQASRLTEGETIVEIKPDLIDGSFVADRMKADDEAYQELLSAIRERGQDTPVLIRPHPEHNGRYMIVFGHRRLRVARELGRPVRAIIKALADIDHIIAQGQENAARANLTFIERVLFAERLEQLGYGRETIQSALSVDYQTLSKMLTIPKAIPAEIIEAIGPAKGVGRDRWLDLRKLIERPANTGAALAIVTSPEFAEAEQEQRFDLLFGRLSGAGKKPVRKAIQPRPARAWSAADNRVTGDIRNTGKAFNLALKARDASRFGEYLATNLDRFYEEFRQSDTNKKIGD
ncbi:plasmid partitioning protein RepB [Phyllobacterium leguminum]|uniref:ParB family chromosome partitioning protein n=1 Tax=Phyllobacterium leguminum TaxID=314237 RepID=A0A318TAI7_9HYPH|nr:plasmid partitioning protein RepB [Phyllobacterium leguminum]PYE87848.1 ParB family chromosome partitioning protein [Phyllobacterium leguminum]